MSLQTKVSTVTAKYTILEGVLEGPCPWDSASIEQQESILLLLLALPCLVCSGVVSLVPLREVSVCASPNEDAQKNDLHLGNFCWTLESLWSFATWKQWDVRLSVIICLC